MKFEKFTAPKFFKTEGIPYLMASSVKLIDDFNKNKEPDDRCAQAAGVAAYLHWTNEKEPYYRIFPGVLEALLKLDVSKLLKITLPGLPFGLNTLEVEIPECYWEELKFKSFIFEDISKTLRQEYDDIPEGMELWAVMIQGLNNTLEPTIIEKSTLDLSLLADVTPFELNFLRILFGILSIGENPDIVKQMVLRKDLHKYEAATPEERIQLVEKARRRGVIGFCIGEDIPTKAQIKRMIEENEADIVHGRKATHYRCSHLAWVGTGKERAIPKLIVRKGCVVNKDLYKQLPQGFYGD